ncbi:zinc ABC transporter substrate-binding protein [Ectothiorhodospiraceae bacterium WFHF3C12]|nr:zinc ABC transporter substrate-binding protein [Ectothiorhodospiraceae bacterium WFHF3C12]
MQQYYVWRSLLRAGAALAFLTLPVAAPALEVFVSVLPQQTFAQRVGGEHVDVRVLVQPGQSPATYDPSAQQLTALENADVLFRIGVPFERSWVGRIRKAMPELPIVDLSEGLTLRPLTDHAHDGADGADEPIDPHVWTSPPLVMEMTRRIAETLSRLDPAHESEYRRNADAFIGELQGLDAEIRQTLAGGEGRAFLVYHPAWGYFADTYGLRQVAIEAAGREPGPRQLARTIERAREAGVRVIFVQPQFSRTNADAVARAIGARVVSADPLAADYMANMRRVAGAFAEALK